MIHSSSIVHETSSIGEGTKIWQFCNIMHDVYVGKNCNIGQNVFIENGVKIGNNVKIKNNISIYSGVICEDDVFLGPSCVFTNVINPRSFIERKAEFKQTLVKKGATVGANATIICGNTLGRYSLIGAGAVVTKDVPDFALVAGNPAVFKGYVCKCGVKLESKEEVYECPECGARYYIKDSQLQEEER